MQRVDIDTDVHETMPSVARRMFCAVAYACGFFVGISVLGVFLVNVDCQIDGKCSTKDRVIDASLSLIWLSASVFAAYKAWRGQLPGCRKRALS
ncbi:hypothetical protein [Undibacterium fentianense]|uniref:Uncharacterized protein n=1 Tax=Undibacterium fentianense TaxID=2828728 RepID=A0A941E1A5_9BURK|nr:hypothetical protein [Undibacterium fentianense]MBR7800540.1 hypothetical protein [Undibacterium fentianense]